MSSKTFPLLNRGVNQRTEPGSLADGQFWNLKNVTSVQEGAIAPRFGSVKYDHGSTVGVIHDLYKMTLGGSDAADPRYFGDGALIYRATGPYTTLTDITGSISAVISSARWEAAAYNSGSNKSMLHIAHPLRMMRDNGSYAQLRPWGIKPPTRPPTLGIADPSLSNYAALFVLASQSGGTDRLAGQTVSNATAIATNYWRVTPTSMVGILEGCLVELGSPGFVIVDKVEAGSFLCFASGTPSGTVKTFSNSVDKLLADGSTVGATLTADGSAYYAEFTNTVDWSFGGRAESGYDTDDVVHFGIYVSDMADVTEMRIRFFCDGLTDSYYEKAITPSQLQSFASNQATAVAAAQARADLTTRAVYGDVSFPDSETEAIKPLEASAAPLPVWQEFDVSKRAFLKIGNAGNGPTSWKTITSCRLIVYSKSVSGTPSFTVSVGAVYSAGGQGPDSITGATAAPYTYVVTARDPESGAEGNPSAIMSDSNAIFTRRRAIIVNCPGVDTDALTGNPAITGYGSLAIYRAGGLFADGIYRFVGFSTNPGVDGGGVPLTVAFIDNNSDDAIAGNTSVDFDNYPPVPSQLRVPFQGKISAVSAATGFQVVTLNNTPSGSVSDYCKPGSSVTIGFGSNAETCIVHAAGASTVTVWLQQIHYVGEQVTCNVILGQPCDIVAQIGDSLVVAGDPNNPNIAYRSKTGRPHAFPIQNLTTGSSHLLSVGSPSNPIYGVVEVNGQVLFLNRSRLYSSRIWSGEGWTAPVDEGKIGVIAKHLWTKVRGEVWFISDDGVYSWGGGAPVKRSFPIDWVFNTARKTVGGIAPADFTAPERMRICGFQNQVWILFRDITGADRIMRYWIDLDRWEPIEMQSDNFHGSATELMYEEDTGRLIAGVFSNDASNAYLYQMEQGTSDGAPTAGSGGTGVEWVAGSGFFSGEGRTVDKLLQDVIVELDNPSDDVEVRLYYDFSATADATDSFIIPAGQSRAVPYAIPLHQVAGITDGKECRSFSIEFAGSTIGPVQVYSVTPNWEPLTQLRRGRISDWDDLGHKHDKRLYGVTIEYNTKGQAVELYLDTLGGVSGSQVLMAVQTITLAASSPGRTKQWFALNDNLIAKKVRLRPRVVGSQYQIFDVQFQAENYPPDTVLFTEFEADGTPYEKYFQQVAIDADTNGTNVTVSFETENGIVDSVSVNHTQGDRRRVYTLNPAIRAVQMRLKVSGISAGGKFQLFGVRYITQPADKGPVGHSFDYDTLGHSYDKLLKTVTIEYENSGGTVPIVMDTLSGLTGGTVSLGVQTFTLVATGRAVQQFPIAAGTIVKAVRLHPSAVDLGTNFKMWGYKFEKEDYPPDITNQTSWNDYGYEHEKIVQEWAFDVDTGGVAASVIIQSDGGTLETVSINSTVNDRERIVTLNPALVGKRFRLLVTPGGGGKFQLFDSKPHFLRGDRGPVEHSFDWDDLGSPNDKKLTSITFEYDTGNQPVTMAMDVLSGIDGTTQAAAVQTFILNGLARSKQTFFFPPDTIAKMVRIRPQSGTLPKNVRIWKYEFDKINYPPDKTPSTEWDSLGWPCDKILRALELDIDTGGVAASIAIQVDGTTAHTFPVTTTSTDRFRIISPPSDIIGKLFRLVPAPGVGGKAQLFGVKYQVVNEPCAVTHWDSYELVLGQAGWKFLKQIWLEYACAGQLRIRIYRDGGQLFHEEILPVHTRREVERFYLPKVNATVLNKSKTYRFVLDSIDSSKPFKLYADSSRIENKAWNGEQREAYRQHILSEIVQPQIH